MHIDTKLPNLGRVISRKKINTQQYTYGKLPLLAASIVRTDAGWAAVIIPTGQAPVVLETGLNGPKAAEQAIWQHLDNVLPDIFGGPLETPRSPTPRKSRAKAKIAVTHESGHTARHHGRVRYVITGGTEGQIMYAARKLMKENQGYGLLFGELETIDGVLTLRGSRSDNCE